jgi:hypothetical protein
MIASYSTLLERVGHYLFGTRDGFTADQTKDILDCIRDGLHRVYSAHDWSFFKPVVDIPTVAPYSDGTITIASGVVTLTGGTFPSWAVSGSLLRVNNRFYSVSTRDSGTQLTLTGVNVTIAAASSYLLATPVIDMGPAFESVANDREIHYHPTADLWYPPIQNRHDSVIRGLQQSNPEIDRPVFYSVRTVGFDPTVGSRRALVMYPTPDAAYLLKVPAVLRRVMVDATNQYPIGGEILSQVILEACLASAEHNFEEREHVHEKRFMEMLVLSIREDQERSSPTSLGPDSPRDIYGNYNVLDYNYRLREQRIGSVTLDNNIL